MYSLLELLKLQEDASSKPFMYSPIGFSCNVCKYLNYNKDEARYTCGSTEYQKWAGTHFLNDEKGEPIKDPSKWCSNWFEPKNK
jgi:hypothetical protein